MSIVQDIDYIEINGVRFRGIGWQGLLTVNTKTYVDTPTRSNDGSMPNIDDHDTFIVPRAKINFKLLSIEDYQTLCAIINSSNQFAVKYWDKQAGDFVTHYMYCEPEEMKKLFNIGTKIIGVLDYEISFIGTLNNLENFQVQYFLNPSNNGSSSLSVANYKWGYTTKIIDGDEVATLASANNYTMPSGVNFSHWNTKADGTGINYYPDKKANIFGNLNLYAQWTGV